MSRAMIEALKTPGLTHAASRFYTYLVGRANGAHVCWPSGEQIASDLGIKTRNTLAAATAELVRRGLITVKRRFRDTNHYFILDPDGRLYGGEPAKPHNEPDVWKTPHQAREDVSETTHPASPNVEFPAQSNVEKSIQESFLQERVQEKSPPPSPPRGRCESVEGWEDFWEDYPRKVAKGAAFKAYVRAVKAAGDCYEVIDVLMEAKDEDRRFLGEPQYIPHPATWLNAGPWHAPGWKPRPPIWPNNPFNELEASHAD